MSPTSILVPIDGSEKSCWAAELSWGLAKKYQAHVTAQHVVDVQAIWEFLAHDTSGFMGSGPYVFAFEKIREQMTSVGQTLLQVYEVRCDSQGVEPDSVLDEGNSVATICKRASDHDIVVIGHNRQQRPSPSLEKRRFTRHSLVERLSHYCPRPLLVVQEPCKPWTTVTLVISGLSPYSSSLAGCAEFANQLSVPLRICYWLPADDEDSQRNRVRKLVEGLRAVYPNQAIDLEIAKGPRGWWMPNIDFEADTLVTVPLLARPDTHETPFGTPSETLVRYCELPYMMLWPETISAANAAEPQNCDQLII